MSASSLTVHYLRLSPRRDSRIKGENRLFLGLWEGLCTLSAGRNGQNLPVRPLSLQKRQPISEKSLNLCRERRRV